MLVLSRKNGERVVIETPLGRIVVWVKELRGARVALGFDAPDTIAIRRGEVDDGREEEREPAVA